MRLKRKLPTFIFGVSIGVIIGGGFFIFKINELFNSFKEKANSQITVIQQPVKHVPEGNEKRKSEKDKFKLPSSTSKAAVYREADSLLREDSQLNIATDELQSVKTVKVIRIGDNIAGADSSNVSVAHFSNEPYFIEFWKTPLNSKGYRFTRNKIMLYGFVDFSSAMLYEVDKSFYIKSNDQVYRLFPTSDFKPLERVVDTELLARIN